MGCYGQNFFYKTRKKLQLIILSLWTEWTLGMTRGRDKTTSNFQSHSFSHKMENRCGRLLWNFQKKSSIFFTICNNPRVPFKGWIFSLPMTTSEAFCWKIYTGLNMPFIIKHFFMYYFIVVLISNLKDIVTSEILLAFKTL